MKNYLKLFSCRQNQVSVCGFSVVKSVKKGSTGVEKVGWEGGGCVKDTRELTRCVIRFPGFFEAKAYLNNIQESSPCHKENATLLHYKDLLFNTVRGNNPCLH
jgi:hypothetical protein